MTVSSGCTVLEGCARGLVLPSELFDSTERPMHWQEVYLNEDTQLQEAVSVNTDIGS